jgi:hypothetical protein
VLGQIRYAERERRLRIFAPSRQHHWFSQPSRYLSGQRKFEHGAPVEIKPIVSCSRHELLRVLLPFGPTMQRRKLFSGLLQIWKTSDANEDLGLHRWQNSVRRDAVPQKDRE